jgi:type IV secretory pathway TraG/TraD family ATPase VirD4
MDFIMNKKSENALSRNENAASDKSSAINADVIATPFHRQKKKKGGKKRKKHQSLCDSISCDDEYRLFKNELNSLVRIGDNAPIEMRIFPGSDVDVFFGNHSGHPYGKLTSDEGHCCFIGGTGSGKSDCGAKNTLSKRTNPAFVLDVKGELLAVKTSRPRKVLYFTDDEGDDSCTFDLYDRLRQGGDRNLVSNARALAEAIVPDEGGSNPFWNKAERQILTGAIVYYFDLEATFIDTMTGIKGLTIRDLAKEILESNNEKAKMCIATCLADKNTSAEMLSGIEVGLSNHISIFASEETIKRVLTPSESTLKLSDLNTHDIFLRMPLERLSQWGAVVRLIITQQIHELMSRPSMHSEEGKDLTSVLLLLDELPQIGRLEVMIPALQNVKKTTGGTQLSANMSSHNSRNSCTINLNVIMQKPMQSSKSLFYF